MKELTANAQAERAAQVARKNRWGIMFLMNAGFLDRPLYKNGWWFVPTQDESTLDQRALKRLNAFRDAGVQITQLIVAHQTTNLLSAPPAPPKEKILPKIKKEIDTNILPAVGKIAEVTARGTLLLLKLAVAVVGVTAYGAVSLLGSLVLLDPALIAVLEDGTWVLVYSWFDH